MLKCLLRAGDGFMTIQHDKKSQSLTVRVNRSRILSHRKPALGQMLLRLHMYRCTADAAACRAYYEELSEVDGEYWSGGGLFWPTSHRLSSLRMRIPSWRGMRSC